MPQQSTHTSLSALSLSSRSDLNIGEQYCAHLHLHNKLAAPRCTMKNRSHLFLKRQHTLPVCHTLFQYILSA